MLSNGRIVASDVLIAADGPPKSPKMALILRLTDQDTNDDDGGSSVPHGKAAQVVATRSIGTEEIYIVD